MRFSVAVGTTREASNVTLSVILDSPTTLYPDPACPTPVPLFPRKTSLASPKIQSISLSLGLNSIFPVIFSCFYKFLQDYFSPKCPFLQNYFSALCPFLQDLFSIFCTFLQDFYNFLSSHILLLHN